MVLTSMYTGVPKPTIKWFHCDQDETEVAESKDKVIKVNRMFFFIQLLATFLFIFLMLHQVYMYVQTSTDTAELIVFSCTRADKGKYIVTAENDQGKASATIEVVVLGKNYKLIPGLSWDNWLNIGIV